MPSPFPGMDPYLEGPLWTTLHFTLGAEIVRQLAPRLRPRYLVFPVERFVMEMPESISISAASIYPDIGVARSDRISVGSGAAVVIAPAPLESTHSYLHPFLTSPSKFVTRPNASW